MKTGIGCGRRLLLVAAVFFLTFACCAGGLKLWAYFSGTGALQNRFTIRENQIVIEEPDFTPPPSLAPGGIYPKTVQIRNTDGADCYVRVCLVYSDDAAKTLLEPDLNTTDWVYDADSDFYYYKEYLKEDDVTKPLLTKIKVANGATREQLDALGAFSLDVVAESCQKGDADTYQEAWHRMTANQNRNVRTQQDAVSKKIAAYTYQPKAKTVVRERKLPVCMKNGSTQQIVRLDRDAISKDYSVTNKSEMSIVEISLELEQQGEEESRSDSGQSKTVLPGQRLPLIPRITNEGADCYVRLRMTDVPDMQEDASGTAAEESDIVQRAHTDTGIFTLADVYGLEENWVQIGEYLYLTKPLTHGACAQAFAGMTVPQTMSLDYMGTSVAVGFMAEAVQADYFTPDFDSDSPWGDLQTENCMYSEYVFAAPDSAAKGVIRLTYEGGAQQFVSAADDFYAQFGAMLPGGIYSGVVQVENAASADTDLFFYADNADGAESLLDGLGFSIVQIADDDSEKVLYDGDYRAKALREELSLGTFREGDGCTLRFMIRVPAEMTNVDALAQAQIDWHFRAQQQEETAPDESEVPAGRFTWGGRTGDQAAVGLWSAAALLAVSVLAGLYVYKCRKRRTGEETAAQTSFCRRLAKILMSAVQIMLILILLLYGGIMAAPQVFGLSAGVVLSGSMEPAIPTGSLCYIREAKPAELSRGEVVAFRAGSKGNGMQVVHRVLSNDKAAQQLRTKGDNNKAGDIAPVSYAAVEGRVVRALPLLGYLCIWVQEHVILLAAGILLLQSRLLL